MCQFFCAAVTRDRRVLFTEEISHETIVRRAGLPDISLHLRHWVRVELPPDGEGWGALVVDETSTPAWFDPVEDGARVQAVAARVRPAWPAYRAIAPPPRAAYRAIAQPARAAFQAIQEPALAA